MNFLGVHNFRIFKVIEKSDKVHSNYWDKYYAKAKHVDRSYRRFIIL